MTSLIRANSGFANVPIIKINQSKSSLMRENLLQFCQKQQIQNLDMLKQTSGTPSSVRPHSKQSHHGSFLTPKELRAKDSPLNSTKGFNETKSGAFSDYFNQQQYQQSSQQQNKLPQINRLNTNKSQKQFEEFPSPGIKTIRQKTNTFSSEYSNFDQNSNASTQDNTNTDKPQKGKSAFFRLKQNQLNTPSSGKSQTMDQFADINYINTNITNQSSIENEKVQQYQSKNLSPPNSEQSAFIFKQQQQQLNIKTLYEEQKKQLQRVEDLISPFPPKSTRKKLSQRMSLNVISNSDLTTLNQQANILHEKIGGEAILKQFVWNLIHFMKKVEFFDIILEDYHDNLNLVHQQISGFLMSVFSDNFIAIISSIQEFVSTFVALNDTNIFQLKAFFYDFLTIKQGVNNTFIDKQIAFKAIEFLEMYRSQLTGNEEQMNLYDLSLYNLNHNIVENFVTSEFFKKYELDKINSFTKILIDLLFNKISCFSLINSFESVFGVPLTNSHINLLKDILKKSLSELKEYNSIFRKNISYQLKKIQWLIPNSASLINYIDVVQSCTELYTVMNKVIVQVSQYHLLNHQTFNSFLKIFYNKHNIFSMIDVFQVFDGKNKEKSYENIEILVSLLKQTLINQKVNPETAKKIEIFTLSIFE
ncbi:hypothetical protein ABPG72_002847 [Tetrahymena utriculariae]